MVKLLDISEQKLKDKYPDPTNNEFILAVEITIPTCASNNTPSPTRPLKALAFKASNRDSAVPCTILIHVPRCN